MGLLDNLRKKSAGADGPVEVATALDGVPSTPLDESWLAGVERRNEPDESQTPTPEVSESETTITEAPASEVPASEVAASEVADIDPGVGTESEAGPATASMVPPPPHEQPAEFPNLGIIYAGLTDNGITGFDTEPHQRETGPEPQSLPSIENGPIGPEAAPLLHQLGLSVGCTWRDVSLARRTMMAQLTASESTDANTQLIELNHAYATLRLLRVGPVKANI